MTEPINRTSTDEFDEDKFLLRLYKILGSCSINFLFGAGVNGGAFPQFSQFSKTIDKIDPEEPQGVNIEKALQDCNDDDIRTEVLDEFVREFNEQDYSLDHKSLKNLQELLRAAHSIVDRAQNSHPETKRINVFTLNYDRIVEELLETSGYFAHVLKRDTKSLIPFNIIGYNTVTRAFIPTFAVYKLHGSVGADRILKNEGIVFPGQDKLGNIVSNFYETLFAMKGELLRKNAALFVIGYSWADDHINDVINNAIDNGLTVVFPKFKESESAPETLKNKIIIIPPDTSDASENPRDTTKTLAGLFQKVIAQ